MYRLIEKDLEEWIKTSTKPLLLYGSRQVGKTYIVKHIANKFFKDKYLYINFFDLNDSLYKQLLTNKTSPEEIIQILRFISKQEIDESWLIIFDEIQELPNLKTSFKLFVDNGYNYKIIGLGSYLKNTLDNQNYPTPIGKYDLLNMYPMNFEEYLIANNQVSLIDDIKLALSSFKPIENYKHEILLNLMYEYMLLGGMPEVVQSYLNSKDWLKVNEIKTKIIYGYQQDITRFLDHKNALKSLAIFNNIHQFLIKENKRFMLSNIDKNARYLNYQISLTNLLLSNLIYKVDNLSCLKLPLKMHNKESEFKLYYNDVGFLGLIYDINYYSFIDDKNNNYDQFKGAIGENFVINELTIKLNSKSLVKNLYYYSYYLDLDTNKIIKSSERLNDFKNKKLYEIDLLLETFDNEIVPIEIKLSNKFKKKSLDKLKEVTNIKHAIILSTNNFSYDKLQQTLKIPLYAVGFLNFNNNFLKLNLANDNNSK